MAVNSEPVVSRRALLASAAAAGATVIGSTIVFGDMRALAEENSDAPKDVEHTQYAFAMNVDRCTGCEHCVRACRYYNHLSDITPDRRHVIHADQNWVMKRHISYACMHCVEPSCLTVCPAGAISKGAAGIVDFNPDRCIGCKYCNEACPFDIPRYDNVSMDKCDVCLRADPPIAPGDMPYCVQACMFGALHWGPLDEIMKEAGDQAHRLEAVTEPAGVLIKLSE